MKNAFKLFEKLVLSMLIISFTFLIFVQFTNFRNDLSVNTSIFSEDSYTYLLKGETSEKGIIILQNLDHDYRDVNILVNGEFVADFKENSEVEITVYNNDIIEIDGTMYNNKINVRIVGISKNISIPELNKVVTTSQSIEILGKVQIK